MKKTFTKITADETEVIFLFSGALDFPWYETLRPKATNMDEWSFVFEPSIGVGEDDNETFVIDHDNVLNAVRKIASGKTSIQGPLKKQCQKLIFEGPDEADFDADAADQVLQFAAFGEIVYG